MSTRQTDIVWQRLKVKGQEKLLLLAIADISNHQGDNIHPSDDYLVWLTGIPERTVKYYKARWREMGALVAIENAQGGRGNYAHYSLNLSVFPEKDEWKGKGAKTAPFRKIQQQTNGAGKDATIAPFENDKGCNSRHERVQPAARKGAIADTKGCNSAQRNKEEPLLNRNGTKSGTEDRRLSQPERDSWDLRRWREAKQKLIPPTGSRYYFMSPEERAAADLEMDRDAAYDAGITIERLQELLRPFFPDDSHIERLKVEKPLFAKETA